MDARISNLAYATEIAAAMLQRQQAGAIIAARSRIVEGAVGMVEHALQMLAEKARQSSSMPRGARQWCATCSWSCAATRSLNRC